MPEKVQQKDGHVDPKFKENHKKIRSTTPEDYVDIFLPFSINMKFNEEMVSFGKMKKWKNFKTVLSGAD